MAAVNLDKEHTVEFGPHVATGFTNTNCGFASKTPCCLCLLAVTKHLPFHSTFALYEVLTPEANV